MTEFMSIVVQMWLGLRCSGCSKVFNWAMRCFTVAASTVSWNRLLVGYWWVAGQCRTIFVGAKGWLGVPSLNLGFWICWCPRVGTLSGGKMRTLPWFVGVTLGDGVVPTLGGKMVFCLFFILCLKILTNLLISFNCISCSQNRDAGDGLRRSLMSSLAVQKASSMDEGYGRSQNAG